MANFLLVCVNLPKLSICFCTSIFYFTRFPYNYLTLSPLISAVAVAVEFAEKGRGRKMIAFYLCYAAAGRLGRTVSELALGLVGLNKETKGQKKWKRSVKEEEKNVMTR